MTISLSRQLAAVVAQTAILEGRSRRPAPQQMVMLMADAKAAADTLRWLLNQKGKTA